MRSAKDILKDAIEASPKEALSDHVKTIVALRDKDYSWRDIADFLTERGVSTNHSKVFRFYQKNKGEKMTVIPTKDQYKKALEVLKPKMNANQLRMLEFHFKSHNRTVTFSQLADEVEYKGYEGANIHYGKLGRALGEETNFEFVQAEKRNEPFYASAIGTGINQDKKADFHFIMHHELADAIRELGWF
ncbi:hypothetical protein [Desulforhopalus sp. IMCC35007]|uniref:hypothetical protein n=1 Tax=Desulforhopalus sp. IMCC35007 TaxID=2569543 RepID=UPI0010AE2756|nr:hypothetical protein [Desulforhopalus sp. IMCC35007]TKB05906.1 hypothetical protein FCL48_22945 [Desulforhopalus sp. IMCC35007]